MNAPHTQLDPFETALLAELREHVVARSPGRRPRRVRRWAAGLAAAAAAGAAVVVTGLGGGTGVGPAPAYAVVQTDAGDVVVTIHRLEDSAGLEAALAAEGIDAHVDYEAQQDPDVITVPGGRVDEEAPPGEVQEYELFIDEDGGTCAHGGGAPATLGRDGDDWVLRIPAGSPAHDRPVDILTSADGGLAVTYPGTRAGTFCSVLSVP